MKHEIPEKMARGANMSKKDTDWGAMSLKSVQMIQV